MSDTYITLTIFRKPVSLQSSNKIISWNIIFWIQWIERIRAKNHEVQVISLTAGNKWIMYNVIKTDYVIHNVKRGINLNTVRRLVLKPREADLRHRFIILKMVFYILTYA